MINGKILTSEDVKKLQELINFVFNYIKDNPELDENFRLNRRFSGLFGESLAIIKLFEVFGTEVKYDWCGGLKKGFDIRLIRDNKEAKIQIKTSTDSKFGFWICSAYFTNRFEIINSIITGDFSGMFNEIEKNVNKIDADFWLLVHNKNGDNDFYIADKRGMIGALKDDYEVYAGKKKNKNTGYGINDKGHIRFKLDEHYGKILKNNNKERWDFIQNFLKD